MTLILSNDDIAKLLPMQDCLERLEETYRDFADSLALSRPRSDSYGPVTDQGRYVFKTMDGVAPRYEAAAIRLNSDVIQWSEGPAGIRKDKQPLAPGGRWVGLVLVFSTRTGEPLAIMPDGMMQQLRVASTNAIAAKYMAPKDATVYALLGSGFQARGQAIAMSLVRPLKEIRVYSPNKDNRDALAADLAAELGLNVHAVDSAEVAVRGADIVGMATNSITPVYKHAWLSPHAHVTGVKELEFDPVTIDKSAMVAVHTRADKPHNFIVGNNREDAILGHDPHQGLPEHLQSKRATRAPTKVNLTEQADLGELVTGRVQLPPAGRMTAFVNTVGLGLQFAAIGSLAAERAREQGVGNEIPTDWLTEDLHP